jgi:hypothetical protein
VKLFNHLLAALAICGVAVAAITFAHELKQSGEPQPDRLHDEQPADIAASSPEVPANVKYRMELPAHLRKFYSNPDGSCVQCSIGMCGMDRIGASYLGPGAHAAATLLWDTEYGPRVRGGSNPSRVEAYAHRRSIPVYNVTGEGTFDWMKWAAKTGRFAAIGAGSVHFQTLVGWEPSTDTWYVANNNSTHKVDEYTAEQFRRLHLASGRWIVVLDLPPSPINPEYRTENLR